jgi:hypothetical protein
MYYTYNISYIYIKDNAGFTIVLKHRAPLASGPSSCQKNVFLRWHFAYVVQF